MKDGFTPREFDTIEYLPGRLKDLFGLLYSLDDFKLSNLIGKIEKIIFISLIDDYEKEIAKLKDKIRFQRVKSEQIREAKAEEEFDYGLSQGDKNFFQFLDDFGKEQILTDQEKISSLIGRQKLLTTYLGLAKFDTDKLKYYNLSSFEKAALLYSLIKERSDSYKSYTLTILEPTIYHNAIKEIAAEINGITRSRAHYAGLVDAFSKKINNLTSGSPEYSNCLESLNTNKSQTDIYDRKTEQLTAKILYLKRLLDEPMLFGEYEFEQVQREAFLL